MRLRHVRARESHRLGLAVAREFAGDQELDADAVLGVAQVLAAGEWRDVTETVEIRMDRSSLRESRGCRRPREPPNPCAESHSAGDRVGNAD